jgi:dTMP kinase
MLMRGLLIAFEGLDQSGKQTQAERLRDRLVDAGRLVRLLSFPAYDTPIGTEIERALRGDRDYGPDVMQLLYVANRYEWKPQVERELARGTVVICDRYLASSVAYGAAQGLDAAWLTDMQKYLPQPDVTLLLDIDPGVSARRKIADRDKYERDLGLLERVRASYLQQTSMSRLKPDSTNARPDSTIERSAGWVRIDADRDRDAVAADVWQTIATLL